MGDEGKGISFNVFVYNKQFGIVINYAAGENYLKGSHSETDVSEDVGESKGDEISLLKNVLNTNTKGSIGQIL